MRLFVVNAPGVAADIFRIGLQNAAAELGVKCESAMWCDEEMVQKVRNYNPDLLFVIHGKLFSQRFPSWPGLSPKAVWLVDEPYETDESLQYSGRFDYVFIQDKATLELHKNAHYLPCCYDPVTHYSNGVERVHDVGFVGSYNGGRNRLLKQLADANLLSYAFGGPWTSKSLRALGSCEYVSPRELAALYQRTKIVLNIWRERHHFNRRKIKATAMNLRHYEALACGALVVSEDRPEIEEIFPDLPTFASPQGLIETVRAWLEEDGEREKCIERCRAQLVGHTYADRLRKVMEVCL